LIALERLLTDEYPALYRFALSISRDQARAEDLTHDALVRALERIDQFEGDPSNLGAWLRRILHNLAIDRARTSAREVIVEEVEGKWRDDDYTVNPEAFALKMQDADELEDALVRLPFIYRSVVILHDVEGWTVRRIAELHDIGLPAAKQRLRRGRMALVTALAEGAERRHLLKGVPMGCWDARQHISDYLDETLESSVARTVEAHLETCPTCPPLYAALVETQASMGGLRDPDSVIPPALDARLRDLLEGRGRPAGGEQSR
jgi:RNA polymerase sigma-70 factor (ECF subfamily)